MSSFLSTCSTISSIPINIPQNYNLPPESLSDYYEERKRIIFNILDINNNEKSLLNCLKTSQTIVNEKYNKCAKGGFFSNLPKNIYELSNSIKENIANYSLIFTLYFNAGEYIKALQLFIFMHEQNKSSIIYVKSKIIEQLPKISNKNKIAQYYPTISKTMLQVLSIFIKLSGKFQKSNFELFYIKLYLTINHIVSATVIKYNPDGNFEMNNQLKNERRYFYSCCLFDLSLYLFNRFHPFPICICLLQHILESYGNNVTFIQNGIESILFLKVYFNLGLFCYINDYINESIYYLNLARERLLEIKYFPITPLKNIRKKSDVENPLNKVTANSTNHLHNLNEFISIFNEDVKFNRKKYKRSSINTCLVPRNNNKVESPNLIRMIKEKNFKIQKECQTKKEQRIKQFSTIFLGAKSLLKLENPILLEQVREKVFIEIELLLGEIELNHKNYKESLNHVNTILTMQSMHLIEIYSENKKEAEFFRQSLIAKSKTVNTILTKNSSSSNGIPTNETKFSGNLMQSLKPSSDGNILFEGKKSSLINTNYLFSKFKNMKYHLSSSDKNRIMLILEQIESINNGNQNNFSDKKIGIKFNNNLIKNNDYKKDKKMITSKEMEKFFIFLCSLSIYQLKILNESQPEPSQRRNDLPIIFSNQFQDCLTNAQRMSLSVLETMSLSRYIILKDTNKDIGPENLDYRFMKYRLKEEDSEDEYFSKVKNKSYIMECRNLRRRSSYDSIMSVNTKNNYSSQKLLSSKKFNGEFEEININIDVILNNILNDENKKFIDLHKRSILKLLNEMSKEERKEVLNCPKLLNQMINNILKKYKIKQNGTNNDSNKD